jgi:hypothetical protein
MSDYEWRDPWDSPQLWGEEQERWCSVEELNDRAREARLQREARKASRYYCPACGEVGYGFHSPVRGWVVESHTRCLPAEGRHDYYYERCPGGRIDPKKDKAP